MKTISVDQSKVIKASPEVIAFLWQNWDIFDALLGKKYNIRVDNPTTWTGSKYGVTGRGRLIYADVKPDNGTLVFISMGMLLGFSGSSDAQLIYQRTVDGNTVVRGSITIELFGITQLIAPLLGRIASVRSIEFLDDGERASLLLEHDREKAYTLLSAEQQMRVEKYVNRERLRAARLDAANQDTVLATLHLISEHDPSITNVSMEICKPKPRRVSSHIKFEQDGFPIRQEWEQIVPFLEKDGDLRTINEFITKDDFEQVSKNFYNDAIKIGQKLFNSYLSPEMRAYLNSLMDGNGRVTIGLAGHSNYDGSLPWELLHSGRDFIALRLGLVRLALSSAQSPFNPPNWKLNGVLLVGASPNGDLDVDSEINSIEKILKLETGISVTTLVGGEATKENILNALTSGDFQVLHFAGHSVFDVNSPNQSYLLTSDDRRIVADELGRLANYGRMKLAYLGSCSSSAGNLSGEWTRDLAGVLVNAGVPFVIGMAWPISDKGAIELATSFYEELLVFPDPIHALLAARKHVGTRFDWKDPAWAAPIITAS